MSHLLHIDSSARGTDSLTRQIGARYVAAWHRQNPEGTAAYRDVALDVPDLVSADWITGVFAPAEHHTSRTRAAVDASAALIGEVEAADVLVLGVPVYNFSVPAAFKAWIDQICMAGRTFAYDENGPRGLLAAKKAVVVRASGSDFGDPAFAAMDFHAPYLRGVLGFIGITDVEFISVSGQTPEQVEAGLAEADRAIAASLKAL
ncbi:FMN-dependent NADH-azoreductase [Streptomyces fuscichromogenes]|uniref:FMN dependent NADH:quinone oxidoreductase n=1 Tax=Streptomyces fuscichromogenes TaxID=1324013 RepID=A0A917XA56_9ACTN|nr:NAD(P)H-dependent oxidoreductase [Streptomyces fuscichromogenes]GGN00022.1 FMN-dependent NADH-azoreductase 2 [Streptomyces fuscichromogenes]